MLTCSRTCRAGKRAAWMQVEDHRGRQRAILAQGNHCKGSTEASSCPVSSRGLRLLQEAKDTGATSTASLPACKACFLPMEGARLKRRLRTSWTNLYQLWMPARMWSNKSTGMNMGAPCSVVRDANASAASAISARSCHSRRCAPSCTQATADKPK